MAAQVIKTTFQFLRGQSEAWTRINPILREGEPGYELDTHKLKIGDGITSWNALPYVVDIESITEEIAADMDAISLEQIKTLFQKEENKDGI